MKKDIILILSKEKKLIRDIEALLPNKIIFNFKTYKSLKETPLMPKLIIIDENFSKIKQKKFYNKMGNAPIIAIIKNLPTNKILNLIDLGIETIISQEKLKKKLLNKVKYFCDIRKEEKTEISFNNMESVVNLYLESVKNMTLGMELEEILDNVLSEMNNHFDFISSEIKLKNYIKIISSNIRAKENNKNKSLFNYNDENICLKIVYKEDFKKEELKIFLQVINALITNYEIMIKEKYKHIQEKKELFDSMIVSLNHHINNPLSIILLESQIINKKLKKSNRYIFKEKLNNIDKNILRIKNVIDAISRLNIDEPQYTPYIDIEERKMISINN